LQSTDELLELMETWGFAISFVDMQANNVACGLALDRRAAR